MKTGLKVGGADSGIWFVPLRNWTAEKFRVQTL